MVAGLGVPIFRVFTVVQVLFYIFVQRLSLANGTKSSYWS